MAYTTNPEMPKVRAKAVALVRQGWSVRTVARHLGYGHSAVVKWVARARPYGSSPIPTRSSRPHRSPNALTTEIRSAIKARRLARGRCGQIIHAELQRAGVAVSLSSVQRTLAREGMLKKRSPWKRPHDPTLRPAVTHPGALLQADTIHVITTPGKRLYLYTLIDLFSRWAWATPVLAIGAEPSARFIRATQRTAPFSMDLIQTDHGSEFSTWFTHACWRMGIDHRHARVRHSNDNAHIERFNRTIQEECLDRVGHSLKNFTKALPEYLHYYNHERLHMGLAYRTPAEVVPRS